MYQGIELQLKGAYLYTMILRYILLLLLFSNISFGQYDHQSVFNGLEGDELFEKLVEDFKPEAILPFNQSRDTLFAVVYARDNILECVYTGHTVELDPDEDPTVSAYQNGGSNGINTEHTYPRSMGAADGNAEADMHHLFPTRSSVNSARGNDPFAEIPDAQTNNWYYLNQNQSNIPSNDIDLWSEDRKNGFEPKEAHKGNVARAMFYFYTMYRDEAMDANPTFFDQQLNTLCDWHWADPVDEDEWNRNQMIAKYQSDKENPFILDCSLASRLYCPMTDAACATVPVSESILVSPKVFPNPSTENYQVEWPDKNFHLLLTNEIGQLILIEEAFNKKQIKLPEGQGVYYLRISDEQENSYTIKLVQLQ